MGTVGEETVDIQKPDYHLLGHLCKDVAEKYYGVVRRTLRPSLPEIEPKSRHSSAVEGKHYGSVGAAWWPPIMIGLVWRERRHTSQIYRISGKKVQSGVGGKAF